MTTLPELPFRHCWHKYRDISLPVEQGWDNCNVLHSTNLEDLIQSQGLLQINIYLYFLFWSLGLLCFPPSRLVSSLSVVKVAVVELLTVVYCKPSRGIHSLMADMLSLGIYLVLNLRSRKYAVSFNSVSSYLSCR